MGEVFWRTMQFGGESAEIGAPGGGEKRTKPWKIVS